MKKIVHNIISYAGALLFCYGFLGSIFKWTAYIFTPNATELYFHITYIFSAIAGTTFVLLCYHPKHID